VDSVSYKTIIPAQASYQKNWYVVDARNQVLGRLASQVARLIRGKHKTTYAPNMDCGDHVIVINADKVRMTGKKWTRRVIFTHSGYPGSQRELTPAYIHSKRPERLVEHAVRGMLPKNRLGRQLFRSLHVYAGPEHPHAAQQPQVINL
jgi:large subunit ribosomal protein L13